jgi:NAD(P)-dependent dehydrogenase (short-subunit alcohol dehydrogenase family)
MDITNDHSVNRAVNEAIEKLGGNIEVLINNAGVGVLGFTEAFSAEDVQRIFDVNVIGLHRVCRAAIPSLRGNSRDNSKGLIINISSLLGRISIPFYGPYNASKWAEEGLSENYRTELSQCGIEVCIVEPGGFPTTFIEHLVRPSDNSRSKEYGSLDEMPEFFYKTLKKLWPIILPKILKMLLWPWPN